MTSRSDEKLSNSFQHDERQIISSYVRMLVKWAGSLFQPEAPASQNYWLVIDRFATFCSVTPSFNLIAGKLPRYDTVNFGDKQEVYTRALERTVALVQDILSVQAAYDLGDRHFDPLHYWILKLVQYCRELELQQAVVLNTLGKEFLYFYVGVTEAERIFSDNYPHGTRCT